MAWNFRRIIKEDQVELAASREKSLAASSLMEKATNRFWYHALPRRKNSPGTRINLTFRKVK